MQPSDETLWQWAIAGIGSFFLMIIGFLRSSDNRRISDLEDRHDQLRNEVSLLRDAEHEWRESFRHWLDGKFERSAERTDAMEKRLSDKLEQRK